MKYDKEKHKLSNRKYYENNRQYVIAKTREWQINNSEKFRAIVKKATKKYRTTAKGIYRDIKQTTRVKNKGAILTQKEFIDWYDKQQKVCFYCEMPEEISQQRNSMRLTIDRMDNTKGYIKGNLTIACFDCNAVKKDILSVEEMKIIGKIIMKKRWNK